MQQSIPRERLLELFDLLNPSQQKMIVSIINSLLPLKTEHPKRDKKNLLNLSLWDEGDIQELEDAQERINEWQISAF